MNAISVTSLIYRLSSDDLQETYGVLSSVFGSGGHYFPALATLLPATVIVTTQSPAVHESSFNYGSLKNHIKGFGVVYAWALINCSLCI